MLYEVITFIVLTILIVYFSLPLINFTGYLNSKMTFPESLSGMEKILKNLEESAQETTDKFLNVRITSYNVCYTKLLRAQQKLLYSTDYSEIRKFTGDGPYTTIFTDVSAPRAGVFVGFKIVEHYMKNNPSYNFV